MSLPLWTTVDFELINWHASSHDMHAGSIAVYCRDPDRLLTPAVFVLYLGLSLWINWPLTSGFGTSNRSYVVYIYAVLCCGMYGLQLQTIRVCPFVIYLCVYVQVALLILWCFKAQQTDCTLCRTFLFAHCMVLLHHSITKSNCCLHPSSSDQGSTMWLIDHAD